MKTNKYPIPNRIWQGILVIFASVIPAIALSISVKYGVQVLFPVLSLLFCCFITYLINKIAKRPLLQIGFKFSKDSIGTLLIACFFIILFRLLILCSYQLAGMHINNVASDNSIAFLISCIVLGPIVEEFLFRGIFLGGLLNRYKPVIAIVCTSLIFGLMHFDAFGSAGTFDLTKQIIAVATAFVLGLLIGSVYYISKNILFAIILHSFANALAIILDKTPVLSTWVLYMILVISLIGLALSILGLTRKFQGGRR